MTADDQGRAPMGRRRNGQRALRKAVVICDSPLYDNQVHGGLQAKCHLLFPAFASAFQVALFCGDQSTVGWPASVRSFPAFSPDCRFKDGCLAAFQQELVSADVLISVETALPGPVTLPTVLIMGGVAYSWSADLLTSHAWSLVITPSTDAADRARRVAPLQVRAIPNGYDWTSFNSDRSDVSGLGLPARDSSRTVLVHPHRPEPGKGADAACDLLASLLDIGYDSYLCIPEQGFHTSDRDYYASLKARLPAAHLDRIVFHRWLARDEMSRYYSAADVTLALGDVPEGFGATIVESIACGTPVLATRRGAVSTLFPADHGVFLVEPGDRAGAIRQLALLFAMERSRRDEMLARGREYCTRHYDSQTMIDRYIETIASVVL